MPESMIRGRDGNAVVEERKLSSIRQEANRSSQTDSSEYDNDGDMSSDENEDNADENEFNVSESIQNEVADEQTREVVCPLCLQNV